MVVKDMQGVISCTTLKTQTLVMNCPTYGVYTDVATTVGMSSFLFLFLPEYTNIGFLQNMLVGRLG